jgi:hypothetical protein
MNAHNSQSFAAAAIEIHTDRRWSMYNRLRELDIPCECKAYQPLRVQLNCASTAIQFWQVFHHVHSSRQDAVGWLEHCWQKPAQPTDLE